MKHNKTYKTKTGSKKNKTKRNEIQRATKQHTATRRRMKTNQGKKSNRA